ncbi:MAG: patatin-like phospholipase family protein, partial [Eubacteriaceae bacterium]|nr:patatin-like phospholipase family protein [Eubacteriaceae bacterium]
MKKAIVFGGGGSRGSYELGAWRALNELGKKFDIATGTSIGSINACMYVQQNYEMAEKLWHELSLDDIMNNGLILSSSIEKMMDQKDQIPKAIMTFFKNSGADITPLKNMLKECLSEERFFSSPINYGLMTVKYPSLEPVEMYKSNIAPGTLSQWVTASSSLFPAFPVCEIDGEEYIDGGYYEDAPVSLALKLGAEKVYTIYLKEKRHAVKDLYYAHPFNTCIAPHDGLGSMLDFSQEVMRYNEMLGYYDVMKAHGRFRGMQYTFSNASVKSISRFVNRFVRDISLLSIPDNLLVPVISRNMAGLKYLSFLRGYCNKDKPDAVDIFLAKAEMLMRRMDMPADRVYDIGDVTRQILSHFDDENRFILPDDIIARSKKKVEDAIASRIKSD